MRMTRALVVSPELMLRPSLSGLGDGHGGPRCRGVSPELMLRPSLSEQRHAQLLRERDSGVAGAYAPAFVERGSAALRRRPPAACVAGAYAPAFVQPLSRPVVLTIPAEVCLEVDTSPRIPSRPVIP